MDTFIANAQVYIETDRTSDFSSLTLNTTWGGGYTGTDFCPMVEVNGLGPEQVVEKYAGSTSGTGVVMSATVNGLTAGTYKIELYGGAAFTYGRGFSSTLFGPANTPTTNPETEVDWVAGEAYTPEMAQEYGDDEVYPTTTGVELYAVSEGVEYGGQIPVYYAQKFPDGASVVTLSGIEVGESGAIQIGIRKTAENTNWHVVQLKSVIAQVNAADLLAAVVAKAEAVDATAISEDLYNELTETVNIYNQEWETAEEYTAAIDAIQAVLDRIDVAISAKPILDAMKALVDATNVYTEDAYYEYYGQWAAKYEEGTLTAAEVSGLQNPTTVTGWHANITVDDFLLSAWDAEAGAWSGYYINTWSTEGNSDGSEFRVPFFEYWTGDGNSLGEKTLTATMNDLEPGYYKATAWVRVRMKNGSSDPYGITFQVNDGIETVNDGIETNVCNGTQIGSSQFYLIDAAAIGTVDESGVLNIKFNVAADNNISWLSFKNVNFEPYVFAPEEVSVGDAITLLKGESETIDYTVLPDVAAQDVTFESADESIATVDEEGKVTGVGYGTTTITVATVANPEVFATVDVEVTAISILEAVNLGFEDCEPATTNWAAGASANSADYAEYNWTNTNQAGWSSSAVVAYGGDGQVNGVNAPASDNNGDEGNALGISVGWSGTVAYQNGEYFLPAGYYTVTFYGYNAFDGATQFESHNGIKLTDGTNYISTKQEFAYGTWEEDVVKFILEEDAYGTIQVAGKAISGGSGSNAKVFFDNITVEYEPLATAEELTALADAISSVSEYTENLGFLEGEFAPYNHAEVLQAVADGQTYLDSETPVGQSHVTNATQTITDAVWVANEEEVNAVYNGNFGESTPNETSGKDVDVPGWTPATGLRMVIEDGVNGEFPALAETTAGRALFTWNGSYVYGETAGYTMPLEANTTYKLKFKYSGWNGGGNQYKVSVLNSDNEGLALTTCGILGSGPQEADCWTEYVVKFTTGEAGDYKLTLNPTGNATITDIELYTTIADAVIDENEDYDVTIEGDHDVTLVRTFKTGVNTVVLPFDVTPEEVETYFGEGTKVYELTGLKTEEAGSSLVLSETAEGITANVPCLVKATAEELPSSIEFGEKNLISAEVEGYGEGDVVAMYADGVTFYGSYNATYTIPAEDANYVVSGSKLYVVNSEVATKGTRAFFHIDDGGEIKDLNLVLVDADGTTTGIKTLDGENFFNSDAVYDLSGRAVKTPAKGLYIINGKKVMVK